MLDSPFRPSPRAGRSPAVRLLRWTAAQRQEQRRFGSASGRDAGTAPFPAGAALGLLATAGRTGRWGEAGASAWLALLDPGVRESLVWVVLSLPWRIPCGPHQVLSPSCPLRFPSRPTATTQHPARPPRVALSSRDGTSRCSVPEPGSRAHASRPGIAWTSIHHHPARVRGDALGKNESYRVVSFVLNTEQAPGVGDREQVEQPEYLEFSWCLDLFLGSGNLGFRYSVGGSLSPLFSGKGDSASHLGHFRT